MKGEPTEVQKCQLTHAIQSEALVGIRNKLQWIAIWLAVIALGVWR